ncbi:MAG: hypothetical protein WC612_08305 [Bdellovibrionales bacterium]|jgi:hypothetical protein
MNNQQKTAGSKKDTSGISWRAAVVRHEGVERLTPEEKTRLERVRRENEMEATNLSLPSLSL